MNYYVLGQNGSKYGPADINLLIVWINEGRIVANTTLEEAATGQRSRAIDIPQLVPYLNAAPKPSSPPPMAPGPVYPSQPQYPGYPRMADQGMYGARQPINIDTHLVKSILVLLFCCQILGIIALVFSIMASSKASAGDPSAVKDAETADTIGNWAIGLGLVGIVLYFVLFAAAGVMR